MQAQLCQAKTIFSRILLLYSEAPHRRKKLYTRIMLARHSRTIFIGVLVVALFTKALLTVKILPAATIDEAQRAYFSSSIFNVGPDTVNAFWDFGKEQGYFLFWFPVLILKTIFIFSPLSQVSFRILSLILLMLSSALFATIVTQLLKFDKDKKNILISISFLIFLLSPWLNFLTTFQLPETITLFLVLLSVFSYLNRDKKRFFRFYPVFFALSAFTSWPGLIFTFSFLLIIAILNSRKLNIRQKNFKMTLAFMFFVLAFLYANKVFVNKTFEKSFAYQFLPKNLAFEINERQKIDFLAVNKEFVLPSLFRKFTYNKPSLAFSKVFSHAISFMDFEQFVSPFDSYEIIRLSGLTPKGNPKLGYIWEVPLIAYGIYLFVERRKVLHKKEILIFFASAFIPYLFFEKKFLSQTAFIVIPVLLLFEFLAIQKLIVKISQIKRVYLKKLIFALILLIALLGTVFHHYSFFNKSGNSQTVHSFLFREISRWLTENKNENDKIVLTSRFGPTHLMSAFYLQSDPKAFWPEYLKSGEEKILDNITIKNFELGETKFEADTIYIGLIGEFVKRGKNTEQKNVPPSFKLIEKIVAEDETVFEYGKEIWIGYFNI